MNKPATLSSHDLLKTFAVIIMVIDHVGYYFYPEEMWFRAIGRIGFPIWFYLVGHASGREISSRLLGGALLLIAMNWVVGMPIFPLNALITIMVIRIVLDRVMAPVSVKYTVVWPILALWAVLFIPTDMVTEYGTLALIFAMFGYMVRHREKMALDKGFLQNVMLVSGMVFIVLESLIFAFEPVQIVVMGAGTMAVCTWLLMFQAKPYPALEDKIPSPINAFMRFCGRRTLEIYVVHLVLFKVAALATGQANYALFSLKLFNL